MLCTVGRVGSVGIATELRTGLFGDWIPVEARFSAPVQTGRETHPPSYTMRTVSFPGVKRPGNGVDHPIPSSAKVKERVELHLYDPSGPSWPVIGQNLPFYMLCEFYVLLILLDLTLLYRKIQGDLSCKSCWKWPSRTCRQASNCRQVYYVLLILLDFALLYTKIQGDLRVPVHLPEVGCRLACKPKLQEL